ncbi:MAG: pilin [Patescibacteria group bacterium]
MSVFETGIVFTEVSPECQSLGECSLDDVMQVFVNISNFILGIVGSLVLAMFVYGGIRWITSQGNPDGIKAGRQAMTGSVIGLFIVFGAFTGINLVTSILRGGDLDQQNKCELVSPDDGGKAGLGYACLQQETDDNWDCITNLCPAGGADIQCCIPKTTTTE